jgi:hypothetical protein
MRTVREQILHRASQPGGDSRSRIIASFSVPRRDVGRTTLDAMVEAGEVIRAQRPAAHVRGMPAVQYFTDPAEARKWERSADKSPRPKPAKPKPSNFATLTDPSNRKQGAHWASLPSKSAPQPVVIPAGLKPKVVPGMPAFDARYQVDPSTRVVGGFASMGVGRYLDGKAS